MLSTILSIGGMVALCAGVAYFVFEYMPIIIEYWNQIQNLYFAQVSDYVPEWVAPFVAVGAFLSGLGLLVKLL